MEFIIISVWAIVMGIVLHKLIEHPNTHVIIWVVVVSGMGWVGVKMMGYGTPIKILKGLF